MPGRLPSPRMADTIVQSIYASELVIDESFVDASGSATRVDITAAIDAGVAGLGATAAGLAILTAANAAAQVTALGGTVTGAAVFTAATAAAAATAIGATVAGAAILTAATAGDQRAAMGVPATTDVDLKADTHPLPTARVDLIVAATGTVVRMIPLFAGTLVTAGMVLDGATTAVDACSVAITIDGVPVVLAAPLSFAAASAAGTKVTATVSSGGAFTANQTIEYTTTSANTAATFGTVSLGATRA